VMFLPFYLSDMSLTIITSLPYLASSNSSSRI
jgi:hypothetical protein